MSHLRRDVTSMESSTWARRSSLVIGLLEFLGAGLWCVAGAGMYGSPLAGMQGEELTRVWTFLLVGPFFALLAAMAAMWKPKVGAAGLIVGGLCSGAVAVTFFGTDAGILPFALGSLPILACGAWLLLAARTGKS